MTKVERNDRIAALWEDGRTSHQIAAELGITRSTVMGVIFRRKLVGHPAHPKIELGHVRLAEKPISALSADVPTEPKPDVPGGFVSILDIRDGMCRWPIDGVRYNGLPVFCGKAVDRHDGKVWSWCPAHHKRAAVGLVYYRATKRKHIGVGNGN